MRRICLSLSRIGLTLLIITALKAFQRANGLRETPALDEATARTLRETIAQQDGSS